MLLFFPLISPLRQGFECTIYYSQNHFQQLNGGCLHELSCLLTITHFVKSDFLYLNPWRLSFLKAYLNSLGCTPKDWGYFEKCVTRDKWIWSRHCSCIPISNETTKEKRELVGKLQKLVHAITGKLSSCLRTLWRSGKKKWRDIFCWKWNKQEHVNHKCFHSCKYWWNISLLTPFHYIISWS